MRFRAVVCALVLSASMAVYLSARQPQDCEGCKDSPLLTRVSGCYIENQNKADFEQADLQVKGATKHVEGKYQKLKYTCTGKTALAVRRNAEQALKTAGYTVDFTGYDVPIHYVTAHKGAQWIAIEANEQGSDSYYFLTTVLTEEMKQEMTANADAWADEISKTGHVAVYGIEFDTGKATLKPESQQVLGEVLKLMNTHADWKMKIEGHTDATGTKAGNQALSEQRAQSVVAWLSKNGVARTRLAAAGLGDTKPIADNKTEDGRAKNRRVELVKQ